MRRALIYPRVPVNASRGLQPARTVEVVNHALPCALLILLLPIRSAAPQRVGGDLTAGIPADAKYACPMETHPDEADPSKQGAYFAPQPGRCPVCGMELKPVEELAWMRIRQAAQGADVAFTCPDHQQVFSRSGGECPRCGRPLMPFKVMYTCPDLKHAGVIRTSAGNCPDCGRGLAAFRGIWLDERMAESNLPRAPGIAEAAAYRCPIHPLVHSHQPGSCTICAQTLQITRPETNVETQAILANTKYTCPMRACWQFSEQPGRCPICGMHLEPIEHVTWTRESPVQDGPAGPDRYVCPMHPQQARSPGPGTCPVCGMQLVHANSYRWPKTAPEHVATQVDYLTEHYLALQSLLASDRIPHVAQQALAIIGASEELGKRVEDPEFADSTKLRAAAKQLRSAAMSVRGENLEQDRAAFVELSAAMSTLIDVARPSRDRWPRLYIYHCPMSKGDWIQSAEEKRNPYYGFKMLTCGNLKDIK